MKKYNPVEHLKCVRDQIDLIVECFLSQDRNENDKGYLNLGSLHENINITIAELSELDEECDEEEDCESDDDEDVNSVLEAMQELIKEIKNVQEKRKDHGCKN